LLNDHQRQVMELVFFEGLSLKEVAERTGQTFVNVRHHYYRGLERLRERLSIPRTRAAKRKIGTPLGQVSPAGA
jgi:RNA polymerase sigma-70 factor (ECF subfamily)